MINTKRIDALFLNFDDEGKMMNELYSFVKNELLSNFSFTVRRLRGQSGAASAFTEEMCDYGAVLRFDPVQDLEELTVFVEEMGNSLVLSLDARLRVRVGTACGFAPEAALSLELGPLCPDAMLDSHHDGAFWMYPGFASSYAELLPRTQSLLIKAGGQCYHLLPLTGDDFRCELAKGRLEITSDMSGLCRLRGAFLTVSRAEDPIEAVQRSYEAARRQGAIRVPLKRERVRPAFFEGFGWCTWDAFYTEVSGEQIYAKLAELREKGIPVKWVVIDDGWMMTKDQCLTAFEADRQKFPEGLGATVARMKKEFGVERVGIWHTLHGYWKGVDLQSPLYAAQKQNLSITPSGLAVPSLDGEKAFAFWDAWHGYLEQEGIDFLKVDNQSSNSTHILGAIPSAEGCRIAHRALERSIQKHFGGAVINCMGMDMENVLARPMSAISRNSDDFYPKQERGFIKHLIQNAYNAIWHDCIHYCDFDMWWSDHHESAIQSGVLRAISGSPVYVSDKIGETNAARILPLLDADGSLMLCDEACKPTLDCIFTDCAASGKLLKVYNRSGDAFALAAFHVGSDEVSDTVDFSQIPGLLPDAPYVAYEYFSKTYTKICADTKQALTLPRDGVAVWSIYPVMGEGEDAYILQGDPEKYLPIASAYKKKLPLAALFAEKA